MYQRLIVTHKMYSMKAHETGDLMALVMQNKRTGSYHVVDVRNCFVCAEFKTEAEFKTYKRQKSRKGIKFEEV